MVAASVSGDLPAGLRKQIGSQPQACHARLLELHGLYKFDEFHLECFLTNNGSLNLDNMPEFQKFLEAEQAKRQKPAKSNETQGFSGALLKRKAKTTGGLSSALNALGHTAATWGSKTEVTPDAKRPKPEAADEKISPERPVPVLQVSLKSSTSDVASAKGPPPEQAAPIDTEVVLEVLGDSGRWTGSRHGAFSWMDETLDDRGAARDARLAGLEENIISTMRSQHENEDCVVGAVGVPVQRDTLLCGRVLCEGLEGRLNERSMLLEGSKATSNGARVQLTVADCPRIAAFPGQIVGVLGRSGVAGTTFHARDFVPGLPTTKAAPGTEQPLHMLVISGPYCKRDELDYTPLQQVLAHVAQKKPQVLILLGPFLDAGHPSVRSGELTLPGEDEPYSFEDFYAEYLLPMLHRGLLPLRRGVPPTEVLIVPSLDEALCFHPMPQPPLNVGLGPLALKGTRERLQQIGVRFLPNPAHLRINGVRVSLTSADALSPVLRELVLRPEGKKIEEALRLLLLQRTLFPTVPRDPPQIAEGRAAAFDFPDGLPPDVLIFPSMSGMPTGLFIDDAIFINPGPLCRPAALGTFAELHLAPGADGTALRGRARVDVQKLS